MTFPSVNITLLHPDAKVPNYAHKDDAGADLTSVKTVTLAPGERALVPTGIAIALPENFVGLIHPRSGLALKFGIGMVNAPGTIDAGYRGEIGVLLINHDPKETVRLEAGTRIAQLVIQEVVHAQFTEVTSLGQTQRGDGGFGSTGMNAESE